ncbi:MAG: hypothetical protein Q9163_001910 [Psora crenata]
MAEALSGVTGSLQGSLQGLANTGTSILDRIISPETRSKVAAWISKFAAERPMLSSFIASHIAITGFPLGLFVIMTISIAIFAILTALILALLGAVLFIVFSVGVALIFLLPILFITTATATFIWLWGMGAYYILKRFNEHSVPGIHKSLKEGLQDEASDYADRGVMEGYGQGWLLGNRNPEEKAESKRGEESAAEDAADGELASEQVTGAVGSARDATKGLTG